MDALMATLQNVFDTILGPAIIACIGAVVALGNKYIKQYLKKLDVKHELENMTRENEIKNGIMAEIKSIVVSVVGANMRIADDLKSANSDKMLTNEQSAEIKENVKKLVMASLPDSLTDDDGVLLDVMGGKERLDIIIDSMIEKCVYDYKIKKKAAESKHKS